MRSSAKSTMPSVPRLSIITPTLNQGCFIEATIHSVMDQGYPNLEYIILDGGSTDGTHEVLKAAKRTHGDRIEVAIEPGLKQVQAINKGLARSTGEILGYINSDDVYLPGAFRTAVQLLDRKVDCKWVTGPTLFFGESLEQYRIMPSSPPPKELARWVLRNFAPQPSTFWRRSVYEAQGGFDERYRYRFDHAYWVRLIARGWNPVYSPWPLSAYRLHPNSFTCSVPEAFEEELLKMREEFSKTLTVRQRQRLLGMVRKEQAEGMHRKALAAAAKGRKAEAFGTWLKGVCHCPAVLRDRMTFLRLRRICFPKGGSLQEGGAI